MTALWSSILSFVFVFTGLAGVLLMLSHEGKVKKSPHAALWRKFHRILGYLFIAVFLLQFYLMAGKVSVEFFKFSPRANLHAALALILLPMLLIKGLLARYFKTLRSQIVSLGLMIFFLAFLMVTLTAGYYFLTHSPQA